MTLLQIRRPGPRAFIAWSGGKNAVLALHRAKMAFRIDGLIAFVDPEDGLLLDSGVPAALLEEQAESVRLPLVRAPVSEHERFDAASDALMALRARGAEAIVFGDARGSLSLEAHRTISERARLEPSFPLAEEEPLQLAERMIEAGLRCVLTAVNRAKAPRAWVGRTFSSSLLEERPEAVHPTGARGEFHTFACGGPELQRPISPRWADLEHTGAWAFARLVPGPRRGYGDGPEGV